MINKVEKKIANFVKRKPQFKNLTKRNYHKLWFSIKKPKYTYMTKYPIKKIIHKNFETFFGYYDKLPINGTNKYLIYHSTNGQKTSEKPTPEIPVNIIIFDLNRKTKSIIDKSYSYNWQQGCRLQWLTANKFIYNVFEHNTLRSKMFDISDHKSEIIDFPIYDCFKDQYALSLNFSRLALLDPAYGYLNKNSDRLLNQINDGIFYISFRLKKVKLILSLDQIIKLKFHNSFEQAKHSVNHIMISPNGNYFMFIHRWYTKNMNKFDRLIVCDKDGQKPKIIAEEMVSHCCWMDNNNIIGYLRDKELGDNFYKIDINNNKINLLSEKLKNYGDGHPSVHKDQIIFDCYPDKSRLQHLFIYNFKTNKVKKIGSFFSSLDYFNETRCDLHPRWSDDGRKIFFDSVHQNHRFLYFLKYNHLNFL